MRRALRAHTRDVLAIVGLILAGLFAVTVILVNQRAVLPGWVPLIGTDRFELKADFSTAQAVTPGQGQSVDISGIKVGEVSGVTLEDGHAVVTHGGRQQVRAADPQRRFAAAAPEDRPERHGHRGRPGHAVRPGGEGGLDRPARLDPAERQPRRDPRRARRRHPAVPEAAARERGRGPRPGAGPGREALQRPAAPRPVRAGHLRDLAGRWRSAGRTSPTRSTTSSSSRQSSATATRTSSTSSTPPTRCSHSFAKEQASIRSAVRELPGTLKETKGALTSANKLALQSGPALKKSLPGAKATGPALRALRPLFRQTAGPDPEPDPALHPAGREPGHARRADLAGRSGVATPGLNTGFTDLNLGLNALAYNPPGTDEGFLFYVPWLNHNLNANYLLQDAYGPIRRGLVLVSCSTAFTAEGTLLAEPYLRLLYQLTGAPRAKAIPGCS